MWSTTGETKGCGLWKGFLTVGGGAGGDSLLADVTAYGRALGRHDGLHPFLLLSCRTGLGLGFHGNCAFLSTTSRREHLTEVTTTGKDLANVPPL